MVNVVVFVAVAVIVLTMITVAVFVVVFEDVAVMVNVAVGAAPCGAVGEAVLLEHPAIKTIENNAIKTKLLKKFLTLTSPDAFESQSCS